MARLIMAADGAGSIEVGAGADPDIGAESRRSVEQAFADLRDPVCRYLVALGLQRHDAEEILQETFLRLCRHTALATDANLRGWVFRVAHNLARDDQRRRQRRPAVRMEMWHADEPDPRATPEQQLIADERLRRVAKALQKLPREQQYCVHLRAEGLRYREIAEVLDVGVSTAADWIQQALKKVAEECDG